VLLSCSKEAVICPHPEPDESSSRPSILFISFSHSRLCLQVTFSFRSPHQNPVCTSPLPLTCYMFRSSWFDHPTNIWRGVQNIKLFLYVVFSSPLFPSPSQAQIISQYPILEHLQPTFLPQYERPSFTDT